MSPLPAPDYLIEAAEAGNRFEVIVKARLRQSGYRISGEQGSLEYPVLENVIIRGHMDASHCLAPDDPTDRLLEVKSMSDRVYKTWMTHGFSYFPEYAAQVTTYMWAEGRRRGLDGPVEATYAVVNRNTDEMYVQTLTEPPADMDAIVQKVALAEQFAALDQLPACDSASQYTCPYDYICDRHEILFEEIEAGTEAMLKSLGDKYQEIRRMEKVVEDKMEEVKSEIAAALGARESVSIPSYTFTNKAPKPRKSLNLTRLRERLGDELDDYFDEVPIKKSIRVYPKKEKD